MPTSQMSEFIQHLRRTVLLRNGTGLTDVQLLEDFISRRDKAALAALVHRHGPMVWGVCRRLLPNYHDAEDAFQATFLVLVRKAASIARRELLANWLYGVAHQTALKARATAAKRKTRERQVTEMPEPAVREQELWNDLQALLDQELSRLPDKYRSVIVLCDLQGKTRKEAARQLGLPEGTVGSRLARSRAMLAKRLARHGLSVSGGVLAFVLSQNLASAGVPTSVVSSTIKAASLFAAEQTAAAGLISIKVAALTEGVLKTMLLTKLKIPTAALLIAGVLGAGGVMLVREGLAQGDGLSPRAAARRQDERPAEPRVKREPGAPLVVAVEGGAESVAWSPDGGVVATVTNPGGPDAFNIQHGVKLWDARTGKLRHTLFKTKGGRYSEVAFSPDGKTVAVIVQHGAPVSQAPLKFDVEIKLWDAETGNEKATFDAGSDHCYAIAFSPDGKAIAAGGPLETRGGKPVGGHVKLFSARTGKVLWAQTEEHAAAVYGIALSPDGKTVASASPDDTIKLWDEATGKLQRTLEGHGERGVYSVAFSPDGKSLASGGCDGTVRTWDLGTGKLRHTIEGYHGGSILLVAFSPDGKTLAVAGYVAAPEAKVKLQLRLLDPQTGKAKRTLPVKDAQFVRSLAFSSDGKTLALGTGKEDNKLILLPAED
jgi:RNA polymerase sigma factor (sigma-70 family)